MRIRARRSSWTTRVATHALREVLVGGADQDLLDSRDRAAVRRAPARARRRLRARSRATPRRPSAAQRVLEQRELRPERGVDAGAGLVAGPEVVAERLDDVVGRHRHVRRAVAQQIDHRDDHAARRADVVARQRCSGWASRRSGGTARTFRRPGGRASRIGSVQSSVSAGPVPAFDVRERRCLLLAQGLGRRQARRAP